MHNFNSVVLAVCTITLSLTTGCGGSPGSELPHDPPSEGMSFTQFAANCEQAKDSSCIGKPVRSQVEVISYTDNRDTEMRVSDFGEDAIIYLDKPAGYFDAFIRGRGFNRYDKITIAGYISEDFKIVNSHIISLDYKQKSESELRQEAAVQYIEEMESSNKEYNDYVDNKEKELTAKATRIEVTQVAGVAAKSYHMPDGSIVTCIRRAGRVGIQMDCTGE